MKSCRALETLVLYKVMFAMSYSQELSCCGGLGANMSQSYLPPLLKHLEALLFHEREKECTAENAMILGCLAPDPLTQLT